MRLKWLLFLSVLGYAAAVKCQTVDFTYSTTSSLFCQPQTVTFTQNCTGNPQGFIWNFGNGQSNVHATDTARYLVAGTYTVTLIGLYADSAIVKTRTITINPTPTIGLNASTNEVCHPGNIGFTAGGSAFVTSYEWNFGDGSPVEITSAHTVNHNFADYGEYIITVKGITAFGCSATGTTTVAVRHFNVTGTIDPPDGCIPANVFLSVTPVIPPGDAAQSYIWDFGDGSPIATGTVSSTGHTYTVTTISSPQVTVTTTGGCSTTFHFPEVGYGIPPVNLHAQTVSGRDTFCGSEYINMTAHATGANRYKWQFGDGSNALAEDEDITYKYVDTGAMHIVVTSMFHGCPGAKDSFDIYIQGVIAKFASGNTCLSRNTFTFDEFSPGIISHFEWTFNNDITAIDSTHRDPTHTFPLAGAFPVKLFLVDSTSGCKDSVTQMVYTARPSFISDRTSVCKDSLIVYSVLNTYAPAAGYTYSFHVDGNIVDNDADSILNDYPLNHGIYNDYVALEHTNPALCPDTVKLTTPTRVKGPVTDFNASPARMCLGIPVSFTNNSHPFFPADEIIKWYWDFWDGKTDNRKDPPAHLFVHPGEFIVALTATDNGNCALKQEVTITVDPIPEITVYPRFDTICLNKDSTVLSAYTIDSFTWDPSTDITCNNCDTIKAYPSVSTWYYAHATNAGGCKNSDSSFIKVYAPFHVLASPLTANVCPKVPVQFNVNTTGIIAWSPAAFLSDTTIANPTAIADSSVLYSVIVTDSAGCYADTADVNLHVHALPAINAGPDRTMPGGTAFTLSPVYSTDAQTYSWSPPGDLNCVDCPRPAGIATQTTNYTVEVTSNKGCKSKDEVKIIITCDKGGLFVPTAFTPYNGGANNYFYPMARGYKTIRSFIVYNRMGNKVFERNNFEPNIAALGWDGSVKGNITSSTQAFVWYIEAICNDGQIVASKGTVLLIR